MPLVSAYQIVGDCVKYENQHGLLQVCPHTSSKFQHQEQFFNITNKHDLEIPLNISAEFPAGIQPRIFLREQGEWVEKFTYSGTIVFQPLQNRYFKLLYDIPINSTGKFNISMSYGEYEAKIDPWWNTTFNYRKPVNVFETVATDRLKEPFTINVTELRSITNCSYLRVTANYSTETEITFNVINETGLSEANGNRWCELLWLVNISSTTNASYVKKNETNYWVYYENLSNIGSNPFIELRAWDKSVQGWREFGTEPVPHNYDYYLGTGTNTTLYYAGNAVQEINSTNYYTYLNLSAGLALGAKTLEFRARITSDFSDNLFGFTALGQTAGAMIALRNATAVGVGELSGNTFRNYVSDVNPYIFHKYRLLFNDVTTTYQLWIDGVLRLSGTNASAAVADQLWIGSYGGTSGGDGEIDYAFIKLSGWLPPLPAVLGGETTPDTPPVYANYGFNVTNSSTFNPSTTYLTWAEWDDDFGISTVIFNLNETNKTYSTNSTGNYSTTWGTLAAGNRSFFTCANDTSNQWNCTATQTFVILKASSAANELLNGTDGNRNYLSSDTLNVTGSCAGGSLTLTRNGTPIANPYYASLAGGTYNFTTACTGNQNYTTTSEQHDANVTQVVTPTPSPSPSPSPTAVVAGVVVETADGYALTIPLLKKECDCYGLNIPFVNWCLWGWVCLND